MTPDHPDTEQERHPAGSPPSSEPAFLAVGRLRRPHGVRGEIVMDVLTDFPERLHRGARLYIGEQHLPLTIRSARAANQALLLAFHGYDTPEAIGELRNQVAFVSAADRPPLEEGEYYHHQLIGLQVMDEEDHLLGKLIEILETGANDVFVIQPEAGPQILFPAIDANILSVDLEKKIMKVLMLPGLMESS